MALTQFEVRDSNCFGEGARERCARCLREQLLGTAGVQAVSLRHRDGGKATLELEYEPAVVALGEIEKRVKSAGACLGGDRIEVIMGLEGMVSPRSEAVVEGVLARLPGVVASASYSGRSLRVEFDRNLCAMPEIARRLSEVGFRITARPPADEPSAPKAESIVRRIFTWLLHHREMATAIFGLIFLIGAVVTRYFHGPAALRYVFVALSFVIAGWYTAKDTLTILLRPNFDIDVLMFAAAIGAAVLGQYEEGAFLLVLFAFGGAGEEMAMDKARRAIEALGRLTPETATVRDADGSERLVKVEQLGVGDRVVVRPFERVAADGQVESGASAVDESAITGESIPAEKSTGSGVYAGTINGAGLLVIRVTRPAAESTLAKIVRLVNEAQTTKSPTQLFADAVEKRYVPLVLISTAALIFVPPLVSGGSWGMWFYRAMAFLTAASPCALAIGTPAAVLSGIAKAARIGVLMKGGVHLENLGRVKVVAFDKTGTLTRGRPEVTDVVPLADIGEDQIIALAASVEKGSSHPLAGAIVNEARARGCIAMVCDEARQLPGMGVCGTVEGQRIDVGRAEMLEQDDERAREVLARLAGEGKSVVVVARDGVAVGAIALADRARDNAADTVRRLREMGIRRTIMLTGDRREIAESMAKQIGVDEVHAELMPEEKLSLVCGLQHRYGSIAMVGDGVNDAPALASATVGIAMGGAGTDVAIETADVALMADDLQKLPEAIGVGRFARKIIQQNLFIALGVIAVLAPSAAMGLAPLGVAVLFHEGSTILVVLNALRILAWRGHRAPADQ